MQKLLIMACPYCGAPEPHAEDVPQGYGGEDRQLVWCTSCGEQCVIDRNLEDEQDDAN